MVAAFNRALESISKVVDGYDLNAKEAAETFSFIFRHDHEGFIFTAFTCALHAKGETEDELFGLCQSTKQLGIQLSLNVSPDLCTDLSGTGGSRIKTINVSTAAAFLVSAAGITVAKQAGFAQTSPTGSGDVFIAFGINPLQLSPVKVEETLETVGICPYFLSAMSPQLKNRSKIARSIYSEKGLRVRSPFHLAMFAYSAVPMTNRIYGCYDERYLEILGHLFHRLGYNRTLVLHGVGGIPEASNVGDTIIVEQKDCRINKYILTPGDFDVKKSPVDSIHSGGPDQNIIDLLNVLSGRETGPKRDLVLVNASASLSVMGVVKNVYEGTHLARQIIYSGQAYQKLEHLVEHLGCTKKLRDWEKRCG